MYSQQQASDDLTKDENGLAPTPPPSEYMEGTGVWKTLFEILAADADNEYAMIDSTIVRAHQHSAGAQKKTAKTKQSGAARAD